jgi:hypothetical protein
MRQVECGIWKVGRWEGKKMGTEIREVGIAECGAQVMEDAD